MPTITLSPTSTVQLGPSWTVTGGGGDAATVLSDNLDSTYIGLAVKCRTDDQVARIGFSTPSVPAGGQIISVTLVKRSLAVSSAGAQPVCYHAFRCAGLQGSGLLTTPTVDLAKDMFFRPHPRADTGQWVTETVWSRQVDPNGNPWTAASFTNFSVELGRDDATGVLIQVSALYLLVDFAQAPTITVTGPTGTVTTTGTPTVTWVLASPDQLPQKASRVSVYSSAQVAAVGFVPFQSAPTQSSGWVLGEQLQWTLPAPLVNDSWTAYVQVEQSWDGITSFYSAPASTGWVQSLSGAPAAVLQSATFDAVHNRVALTFAPSSSSPTTVAYRVETSRDGNTWAAVLGGGGVAANGMTPVTVYDNAAPANQVSQYRVLGFGLVGGVNYPAAGYSNQLSVTPTVGSSFWVKDPLNPLANIKLPVAYEGDEATQGKNFGVFDVLGPGGETTFKVVVEGGRYGIEGTLTLIFSHVRDAAGLWELFDQLDEAGRTLLLQYPTGEQRWIRLVPGSNGQAKSWKWEITPRQEVQYRKATVGYVEVREPVI